MRSYNRNLTGGMRAHAQLEEAEKRQLFTCRGPQVLGTGPTDTPTRYSISKILAPGKTIPTLELKMLHFYQ